MSLQPFSSPKRLIARAQTQIREAEREITSFFDSQPYARVIEMDRKTGQQVHMVRLTRPFPDHVELIIKEAAGHLRDALDHACYGAAVALGNQNPIRTGFPFAKELAGVQGELSGPRLRDNPVEIRPLLEGLKPYEGGNDLLWGLNSIRNPSTHRSIVPVGHAMAANISIFGGALTGDTEIGYSRWDAAKNEVEYMRLGRGSHMQHDVSATFSIVFEGTHALGSRPVIPTLDEISGEVGAAVTALEAETTRILASRP